MKKLISHYHELFSGNKRWLCFAVGCFLLGCVIGVAADIISPDRVMDFLKDFKKSHLHDPHEGFPAVMSIFSHNFSGSVKSMLIGVVLGFSPLIELGVNGFAMGCVISIIFFSVQRSLGFSLMIFLAAILPHGIVELPTVIFSAALGLKIGWAWLRPEAKGNRLEVLKTNFIAGLWAIPGIAVLLFIAALIEVFITPPIIHFVVGDNHLNLIPYP